MTFKNQKEEVIEIELTSYGKHLLSKGKFRPAYYAFFDDDILYDAEYGGEAEEQNSAQPRLLEETPRLRVQVNYSGAETQIEKQIEESRANKKSLRASFQPTNEKHYALSSPLGRSSLTSEYAPAWDVTIHGAEFEQQLLIETADGKKLLRVPQMNIESLEYTTSVVDGSLATNTLSSVSVITDHAEDTAGLQEYYENGNIIKIDHKDIIIEIDELHTDNLSENYDVEIFIVEEDKTSEEESLVSLSFMKELESNIVDGIYIEPADSEIQVDPDETFVENYLDVTIDTEIDSNALCRLGYRTDHSKRGFIRVKCSDIEKLSKMNEIYDPVNPPLPPFGDDC
jgi:hypothetical protein